MFHCSVSSTAFLVTWPPFIWESREMRKNFSRVIRCILPCAGYTVDPAPRGIFPIVESFAPAYAPNPDSNRSGLHPPYLSDFSTCGTETWGGKVEWTQDCSQPCFLPGASSCLWGLISKAVSRMGRTMRMEPGFVGGVRTQGWNLSLAVTGSSPGHPEVSSGNVGNLNTDPYGSCWEETGDADGTARK